MQFLRAVPLLLIPAILPAQPDPRPAVNLLAERCLQCHSAATKMGGIQLTSSSSVIPLRDRIVNAIQYQGKVKMPPNGALPPNDVAILRDWLNAGAPFPANAASATAPPAAASKWWAFRAPVRPSIPSPPAANPIDAFLNAKLAAKSISASAAADRATLIRRATFDLHGLPPTYAETQNFINDSRPNAWQLLIDRLLASPRYGEKWGKHWLDLARYGDTSGFEQDPYLLYAFRYRDYVIQSFNDDKPYDQFIKEQIAGDELFPEDPEAQQGTGFYTVGTNRDMLYKVEDINREESLTDFVDTTSSVFLGLTVGCARCHDHKFDPIPQRDYYRLQAIFAPFQKTRVFLHYNNARGYDLNENTRTFRLYELGAQLSAILDPHRKRLRDERLAKLAPEIAGAYRTPEDKKTPEQKALTDANAKKVEPTDDEVYAQLTADENAALHKIERRMIGMYRNYAPGPFSPAITDIGRESPRTYLPAKAGGAPVEVTPGLLSVLGGGDIPEPPVESPTTLRRKALAEWIASPNNPMTARVMANRIWQYHFGRGLLPTSSDFGTRAGEPTHPELLDWLATEFVSRKWSFKEMHRLIMTSGAYQRSARAPAKVNESDPENTLLSHFSRRRLDSEELRDAMLAASGSLNLKMGGRAVVPPLEPEELYGMSQPIGSAWIVTADAKEHDRRSIYLISRRNFRVPLLEAFDRPEGVLSCSRRESSTTAPQSLSLLNGKLTLQKASALAASLEPQPDPIAAAYRAILCREPSTLDREKTQTFLTAQQTRLGSKRAALTEMVRALFNVNEFLYVE